MESATSESHESHESQAIRERRHLSQRREKAGTGKAGELEMVVSVAARRHERIALCFSRGKECMREIAQALAVLERH
jgi:hypothetical protein